MNIKPILFAAIAAFALNQSANAQTTIGVGVPTGTTRNDTYIAAGFEFYAPPSGTTINALGFWDANGTGLLAAHTVSIFKYDNAFNPSGYDLVATATIPAGTVAPLINGYRWVGISTLTLPNNGQGGGYYAILATQDQDTWANNIGPAPYLDPSIGTVSGQALIGGGQPSTVLSSSAIINGTGNPNDGFGGANLAFLTPQPSPQPVATPILWIDHGEFTDNTVLSLAGDAANEVYGVDFGAGLQTTANGYTFDDYTTTGNMTLNGGSSYDSFLGGGGTTGDSSLDAVLNNGVYAGGYDTYATLHNLTIGQRYSVLALEADTRGSTGIQFNFTDDLAQSPSQVFTFPGGTPSIGGYVLGTFTATATSQLFSMVSSHVQYNGILVVKVPATGITLVTNTLPASVSVVSGSNIVFTAAFSNSPAVTLQWQQIISGSPAVTNDINTGVVIWTNNGVVSSTLTLTNLQVANAGSYRLKATDAANSSNVAYSAPASLTIIPVITWYAAGTYNNAFTDNSVLALAGSVANEVYGVDFGGSGLQVTANGYTFDDCNASGNMTVVNNPSSYNSYLGGGGTTGDPALDSILTCGLYGSLANTGTLNNLTIGQTYTVLVLLADTRGTAAGGSIFHVTDGATVSPGQQYAFAYGIPAVGGYIMGTFTAQTTTQPLTILNVLGAASQYNAILLEKGIAAPPPIVPGLKADIAPLQSDVPAGASMTFTVAASGTEPLHYQWFNQGRPIANATNSSYSLNAAAGTNSYYVSVTNSIGAIVSSTAVVVGETTNPPALVAFNDTDWALNGNGNGTAYIYDNQLILTDGNANEACSAFYDIGQYIGGFVASFTYQASGQADGATFCLQNSPDGTNALGSIGGGLGYSGIMPSAAFEMNLYAPIHGGIGVRVGTNGTVGDYSNDGYIATDPVNIASGDNIYIRLCYLQGVMQVSLTDQSTLATYSTNFPIDLPALLGNSSAYIGFTASDGGTTSSQTVSNFLYSSTTLPVLAVKQGGPGQVIVSWPVSVSSLFTLVQSSSLNGPWTTATPVSSAIVGTQRQATLSALGGSAFYRLELVDPNAP